MGTDILKVKIDFKIIVKKLQKQGINAQLIRRSTKTNNNNNTSLLKKSIYVPRRS